MTPSEVVLKFKNKISDASKWTFMSAFVLGLIIHMPILFKDIPNHDGLSSMHFDQNMITSGRWFLGAACGLSSFYTLPWVIGLFSIILLGVSAALLIELLEIKDRLIMTLISGLLVSFPAIASNFAYVFTMDGYMLGILLAILSVLVTKKYRWGFIAGAVSLAFSMGIYQAYLPFAIILCLYSVLIIFTENKKVIEKLKTALHYLYMGGMGVLLYYLILHIMLKMQGKVLDTYQGINGLSSVATGEGIWNSIVYAYMDFAVFSIKGNIVFNNIFSGVAIVLLLCVFAYVLVRTCVIRKWWKSPWFFVIMVVTVTAIPIAANAILLVSPGVTYHLLMRYQWVLFMILLLAFCERFGENRFFVSWAATLAVFVLVFNYAITDNIAYSNLEKRYEKTYAYCVRLLDRIEQTEGYYQGIPVAIVGVVGYVKFPTTDITEDVTAQMIGISGDSLLYTSTNYQEFMKNYLGASINFLSPEDAGDFYYSDEYVEMESFPGATSVKNVDGVIYVKTENVGRD